jgi:hypothetical protein
MSNHDLQWLLEMYARSFSGDVDAFHRLAWTWGFAEYVGVVSDAKRVVDRASSTVLVKIGD